MSMRYSARALWATLAVTAIVSGPTFADVLVVDASGGGSYTQIQPAVDAASDGDTILVKTGAYAWFSVTDKALTIVGDAGSDVEIAGSVTLRNLAASKTLVVENLKAIGIFDASNPHLGYGISISNNQGHVRIENCHFTGATGSYWDGSDAIRINACSDVSLTRTNSLSGAGDSGPSPGGHYSGAGVFVTSSTVAIYDCTLTGANGQGVHHFNDIDGGNGGDGAHCGNNSVIFASGSSFIAGNGGQGGHTSDCFGQSWGGDGGNGIELFGASVVLLDDIEQAGQGGPGGPGNCDNPGDPGLPRAGFGFTDLSGASKHMTSPTPERENTVAQLTFSGTPGDQVALIVANDADYVLNLSWKGVVLVTTQHPLLTIPIGTIPSGGILPVSTGVLDLGGQPAKLLHVQPVFIDAQGHHTLGTPSSTVILSHVY
jgi:hypothetical protein